MPNEHDHLFLPGPLNQWDFFVLSENGKKRFWWTSRAGAAFAILCLPPSRSSLFFAPCRFFTRLPCTQATAYPKSIVTCMKLLWTPNGVNIVGWGDRGKIVFSIQTCDFFEIKVVKSSQTFIQARSQGLSSSRPRDPGSEVDFHDCFSNSLIIHELKSLSKMDKFVTCMAFDTQ